MEAHNSITGETVEVEEIREGYCHAIIQVRGYNGTQMSLLIENVYEAALLEALELITRAAEQHRATLLEKTDDGIYQVTEFEPTTAEETNHEVH